MHCKHILINKTPTLKHQALILYYLVVMVVDQPYAGKCSQWNIFAIFANCTLLAKNNNHKGMGVVASKRHMNS